MKLLNKQDLDKLVEEPFEKFLSRLDLKCPAPIEAISIEWLKKWAEDNSNGEWSVEYRTVFNGILKDWEKENEQNKENTSQTD